MGKIYWLPWSIAPFTYAVRPLQIYLKASTPGSGKRDSLDLILLASLASCSTLHSPAIETSVSYASQYWFRGAVQNDNGVVQGDVTVSL